MTKRLTIDALMPDAAIEACNRIQREFGFDDDLGFVFSYLVGSLIRKLGPHRVADLLNDLVAAIHAVAKANERST